MVYVLALGFVIYLALLGEMLNPCSVSLHKAAKCCCSGIWAGIIEGPAMEKTSFKLETKHYY